MKELESIILESIKECNRENKNVKQAILDVLETSGFDVGKMGTHLLVDIIETLYHERKEFDPFSKDNNFNDIMNVHYLESEDSYGFAQRYAMESIYETVDNSDYMGEDMNDVIYGVINEVIDNIDDNPKKLEYIERR